MSAGDEPADLQPCTMFESRRSGVFLCTIHGEVPASRKCGGCPRRTAVEHAGTRYVLCTGCTFAGDEHAGMRRS